MANKMRDKRQNREKQAGVRDKMAHLGENEEYR